MISRGSTRYQLTALEELNLRGCSGLTSLPEYSPSHYPALRRVCLIGCYGLLKSKPNLDDLRKLGQNLFGRHGVDVQTSDWIGPWLAW